MYNSGSVLAAASWDPIARWVRLREGREGQWERGEEQLARQNEKVELLRGEGTAWQHQGVAAAAATSEESSKD